MATYAEFDPADVSAALEAARQHYDIQKLTAATAKIEPLDDGHLSLAAGCVSVTVNGNKICVNLPLNLGGICLPIPISIPNGTVAQACIRICTTWGLPTGVRLTVTVGGVVIVEKTFLKC